MNAPKKIYISVHLQITTMQSQENINSPKSESRELSMTNNLSEQTFFFDFGKIRYFNTLQENFNEERTMNENLQVQNFLCEQNTNKLTKTTRVCIQGRQFFIKDSFELCPQMFIAELQNGQDEEGKEFLKEPSQRRDNYSNLQHREKRDTKNLVKNIITIFLLWVRKKASESEKYEFINRKILTKFKEFKFYNKKFLYNLSQDQEISEQFIRFRRQSGYDMIQESRIKDKDSHKLALQHYTKIFNRNQKQDKGIEGKGSNFSTKV